MDMTITEYNTLLQEAVLMPVGTFEGKCPVCLARQLDVCYAVIGQKHSGFYGPLFYRTQRKFWAWLCQGTCDFQFRWLHDTEYPMFIFGDF